MKTAFPTINAFKLIYVALLLAAVVAVQVGECKAQWTTADASQNINSTNSNNVGVGTTAPNYKLDLTNALNKAQLRFGMGSSDSGGYLYSGGPSHATFSGGASFDNSWMAKSLSASIIEANLGGLTFYANGGLSTGSSFTPSARMVISSGGFVGIGTTIPTSKLHMVSGTDNGTTLLSLDTGTHGGTSMAVFGNASNESGFDLSVQRTGQYTSRFGVTSSGQVYLQPANNGVSVGNVGIGTSTPGYPLEIYSNQNAVAQVAFNNPSSGGSAQAAFSFFEGATQKAKFAVNSSGASSYVGGINAFQIWNFQNAPIVFGTNAAEQMRIAANGNVGIGTPAPNSLYKLDIAGKLNTSGGLCILGDCKTAWAQVATQWNTVGSTINYTGGNVGIGTTSPAQPLDVNGNINASGLCIGGVCKSTWSQIASQWNTSGLTINYTGGNVGIGTSSPVQPLDVNGNINASGLCIVGVCKTTWSQIASQWSSGASNTINYATGNVGIGTSAPQDLLHLYSSSGTGTMRFQGGGTKASFIGMSESGQMFILTNNRHPETGNNFSTAVAGAQIALGGTSTPGDVSFYTTSSGTVGTETELMRIKASGTVGIGTTNPNSAYKLDVAGQVHSSSGGFVFPDGSVQATAAGSGGGTITGVIAGAGLTGGGTSGSPTLNVGAGTGVSVAADTISVNYGLAAGTAVEGNKFVNVTAGAGMSGGGQIILGAGGTVTLDNTDRGSAQNIFKNISNSAGGPTISATLNSDTLTFAGAGGTTVSFSGKTITIDGSTSNISAAKVSSGTFGSGSYIFPNDVTVNGTLEGTNIKAKYQDVAEWVESSQELPAATVVVLDTSKSNQVVASTQPYDSRIAGVISNGPGIALGEQTQSRVLVATTGRVKVKVDASNGPIQIGDLLVTSDKPGVAMKSIPVEVGGVRIHRPGTLIGKALEPLSKGTGEILVLLSLQ